MSCLTTRGNGPSVSHLETLGARLVRDGGDHAQFGYTRYGDVGLKPTGKEVGDINGGPLRIAPAGLSGRVHHVRFYDRYLTTTEMVGNFRAGL